ncbi:HAMP domain-containing sensor histidine kinase [Citricoccus sp. I39-566]|uniref:sensor histidine kinase n=1 Tax=Citricoccus sp. I39-566 TaxID=3073268 RepID=UPI00286D44A2|nr:HAMP domain-containing sensor histidine kinase [Citricoccus sp. I39-566]WMY78729.1 HAMP domain-containing sensor histidine kinase [Citricoccus sp. I39-566]
MAVRAPVQAPPRARRRPSLALRTALGVVVLLAVVLTALTATSLVLSGRAVDAQLEHQVEQAWERSLTFLRGPGGPDGGFPDGAAPGGGTSPDAPSEDGGFDRSPLEAPGQPAGMLALVQVGDTVVEASRLDVDGQAVELSAADVQALASVVGAAEDAGETGGSDGSAVQRVQLDSGSYLVRAAVVDAVSGDGEVSPAVAVAGLPTAEVDGTKAVLAWVQVIGSLTALVVAGVAGWWWIRRSLRPLAEVSRAAARVAEVPMGSGEVSLARYRVRGGLAQPGDEVGEVGHALNRLVDSVDGAFEQRNRSERKLRTFVADASHELRTPLAAVRGYTEMVRMTEPLSQSGRDSVDRVLVQADRMGSLVEDLLLLARLDAAEAAGGTGASGTGASGAGDRPAVDLGEIVVDAVMDATAAGRDHTWTVDVPEGEVTVAGDRQQLAQLVANLLSNARKHTPAGTTVAVRLDAVSGAGPAGAGPARLEVEDDGPGIGVELLPTLFDRFVRGDAARTGTDVVAEGSTGLGLAIVRSVARAHGGDVRVESAPGRTVFAVELPRTLP